MYSVGGKTVSVENKFPEKRVNTLTFQVQGTEFPKTTSSNDPYFMFGSEIENSFIVNYGDGESDLLDFEFQSLFNPFFIGHFKGFEFTSNKLPNNHLLPHSYQDSNTGPRFVTFDFQDLSKIIVIDIRFCELIGNFPIEIGFSNNLKKISLRGTNLLGGFPESLSNLTLLEEISLSRTFETPLVKIPDGFFNNKLKTLNISSSFNLNDVISSNLFKINQLSDTLDTLNMSSCNIQVLPSELSECLLLTDLRLRANPIKNPEPISNLSNLDRLYIACDSFENGLFETNNLTKLRTIWIQDLTETLINEIPLKWTGFKALVKLAQFKTSTRTNPLFQTFIENFYILCTENGFLDPSSTEAQNTGFPEQFRDISWGDGNDWFTVTNPIQAPSGFSQGVSNGTPANNAEKIYVLVENYGHSVELAS
jgi:hypothetical protein